MAIAEANYQVVRLIGSGGTAEVYEASAGGQRVAIKRFLPEHSSDEFLAHFLEEAHAQLAFRHPSAVRVLDFGISDGRAFLVLELVDGEDLVALEERAGRKGEVFPPLVAIQIAAEMAEALDAAHHALDAAGRPSPLIHGDVSPENVLVSHTGEIKLTDFGLADGRGKPGYAAPERARTAAADVYALAATFRWMVGDEAPKAVSDRIAEAMDPDPAKRPSAGRFAAELWARTGGADGRELLRAWLQKLGPAEAAPAPPPAVGLLAIPKLFTGSLAGPGVRTRKTAPVQVASLPAPLLEPSVQAASDAGIGTTTAPSPPGAMAVPSGSLIGSVLHGFRIEEAIAHRRFASVYRARHLHFDRFYAVKVMHAELAADNVSLERFKQEALLLSRLEHPNIVRATDFGVTPDGQPFIAMELLTGPTLMQLLEQVGRLAPERALRITRQIASALEAAHQAGLVHRDVKPSNVLIVGEGANERAVLLDFGIAHANAGDARDRLTATGELLGTPAFMAPEQIVGARNLGPSADLYGLGCTLFTMLTGTPPFGKSPLPAMQGHLHQAPPILSDHPRWSPLLSTLLAKRPEQRPGSASAVISSLDALAPSISSVVVTQGRVGPHPWALAWAGAVLLLIGIVASVWLTRRDPAAHAPAAAPLRLPVQAEPVTTPSPSIVPRAKDPVVLEPEAPTPLDPRRRTPRTARSTPVEAPPSKDTPPAPAPEIEDLKRAIAALRPQIARLPPAAQTALDQRYLDLRSSIQPDLPEDQRRTLGTAIQVLAKDVAALQSPSE